MRLPATRFGFSVERGWGRTRPPATMPRHLDTQLLVSSRYHMNMIPHKYHPDTS
ncbi:hypothetical protein [Oryza sativa Japonica Group]|uniref:Uncharacterized protein n=1 Tax=Oryza sativa subsp. japonica TaxID=39947 RepID=Q5JKL4_ORYSJ|nr:hypothetical protein [Oryza sativa Japonica Group]